MRNSLRIDNTISSVKQKALCIIMTLAIGSAGLCGCSLPQIYSELMDREKETTEESVDNGIAVFNTEGEEITTSESVIDMMEEEEAEESFVSAADLVSSNDRLFEECNEYGYSKLNSEEQIIYREILAILDAHKEDVLLSTLKTDVIDLSFRCVLMDHPELFYVSGYSISKYTLGDVIKKITFTGTYTMDAAEAELRQGAVDDYVAKCLSGISQSASDYEKVKYVYEYLINDNTYDTDSENNQNILSVCENHVTVCQGYAKMTQLLLNKLDIFCTLVYGSAENAGTYDDDDSVYYSDTGEWGAHVWNIVMVNGKYYIVDTTWGDASFLYSTDNGDVIDGPDINYDYLLVPDSMILDTHLPKPTVEMPSCVSMDDNYYVREGLYFTKVDSEQLEVVFDKAYANGQEYVSIKCSDNGVYADMRTHLFEKEHVFDYLSGTSVRYVEYSDRNALSIYL